MLTNNKSLYSPSSADKVVLKIVFFNLHYTHTEYTFNVSIFSNTTFYRY